jgi:hypothetical protein
MAIEHDNELLLGFLLASTDPFVMTKTFEYLHRGELIKDYPLGLAVCKGNERLISMLERRQLLNGATLPICHAIYIGEEPVVRYELKRNSKQNLHICQLGRNPIVCAV